jgi:hypothetical protein
MKITKKEKKEEDRFQWYLEKEGITGFLFDCLLNPLHTLMIFFILGLHQLVKVLKWAHFIHIINKFKINKKRFKRISRP